MNGSVRIFLRPLGASLTLEPGAPLRDALFPHGVEFPCGGRGQCKGCRVRVLAGSLAETEADLRLLSDAERADGWRLACCARPSEDVTIELAQWEAAILADESAFAFTPRPGLGVALDLGSTTVVAQLLDLQTGHVVAVRSELNAQARFGADIMSRIEFGLLGGETILRTAIREQVGRLIEHLVPRNHGGDEVRVVAVGNTVMHHLFCGLDIEALSRAPFESARGGFQVLSAADLGWRLHRPAAIHFLPCIGGFVGSDILAGIVAVGLHRSEKPAALVDLGTNGEIVVGNRERMLCASTAAGPAFEGARISMGMRAATGAISEVNVLHDGFQCRVLGNAPPRGICGSGLVDAAAAALDLGRLDPSGRLRDRVPLELLPPVRISQADIRELQLAKGAIAAGLRILVAQWGATLKDLTCVYLSGAFGNHIHRASARRIGLLGFPPETIVPAGNTALLGAKLALFDPVPLPESYVRLRRCLRHVSLHEDPRFEEIYVEEIQFPR